MTKHSTIDDADEDGPSTSFSMSQPTTSNTNNDDKNSLATYTPHQQDSSPTMRNDKNISTTICSGYNIDELKTKNWQVIR
jgi:hypothetical protein